MLSIQCPLEFSSRRINGAVTGRSGAGSLFDLATICLETSSTAIAIPAAQVILLSANCSRPLNAAKVDQVGLSVR